VNAEYRVREIREKTVTTPLADPGFDLGGGGGVKFVNGGGGGGRKALKVMTVEI